MYFNLMQFYVLTRLLEFDVTCHDIIYWKFLSPPERVLWTNRVDILVIAIEKLDGKLAKTTVKGLILIQNGNLLD